MNNYRFNNCSLTKMNFENTTRHYKVSQKIYCLLDCSMMLGVLLSLFSYLEVFRLFDIGMPHR